MLLLYSHCSCIANDIHVTPVPPVPLIAHVNYDYDSDYNWNYENNITKITKFEVKMEMKKQNWEDKKVFFNTKTPIHVCIGLSE